MKLPFEPELIEIPAGKFEMGEGNARQSIYLQQYSIGKYPVKNSEYQAFVDATNYELPSHWMSGLAPEGRNDHPVVNVSWWDAMAYCSWLAEQTNQPYMLPSEAEWEKAARGSKDARRYPWGEKFDKTKCNTSEAGFGRSTPLGQFSPQGDSPYGCVDMSGNVWDWTRSLYFDNPFESGVAIIDSEGKGRRVLRGGSFFNEQGRARVSRRYGGVSDFRRHYVGFRVALLARREDA